MGLASLARQTVAVGAGVGEVAADRRQRNREGACRDSLHGSRSFGSREPCRADLLGMRGVQLHVGGVAVGLFECRDLIQN